MTRLLISGAWLLVLASIVVAQVRAEENAETVRRRAREAAKAADQALPRAKGTGRYELTWKRLVNGQLQPCPSRRGKFLFAYAGPKSWIGFVKAPDGVHDAAIYITDEKSIMVSEFSAANPPDGAAAYIERNTGVLPDLPGWPPSLQTMRSSWEYLEPGKGLLGKDPLPTLQEAEGLHVLQCKSGRVLDRFYLDPSKGFHLVRIEAVEEDGTPIGTGTRDWRTTADGLWYVREYCQEGFPIRKIIEHTHWRFTFDTLEPNAEIPAALFTLDALALPVGATIRDRRSRTEQTLYAQPPQIDMAVLERFVGQLPQAAGSRDARSK